MLVYNTTTNTLISAKTLAAINIVQAIYETIYVWSKVTVRTNHKTYMKIRLNNPSDFLRKNKRVERTVNYNEKVFNAWKRIFGDES